MECIHVAKSLPFCFYGGFALENAGPLDQLYKVGSQNKPESAFCKKLHISGA
jgi:hypothetical protein